MNEKELNGIGGWLILPMLGLILTPIRIGYLLLVSFLPILTDGSWEILTTPGSHAYHELWGPVLIFEMAVNIIFGVTSIVLLILLFSKHHLFPKLIIGFYLLNIAFIATDNFISGFIPAVAEQDDTESTTELIRSIITAAIWIPYFLKSERIKNTFTKDE